MLTVLDACESSVHGLSYAVSFVSILTILPEIMACGVRREVGKTFSADIRILAVSSSRFLLEYVWSIFEER